MEMSLRVGDIVLVDEKDKSYLFFSGKDAYVTVCYLVSGESEEVEVERCREVPLLEGTGYWSGNHSGVTVTPLPQEESISIIAPHVQSNALYAGLKIVLKATKNWLGNSGK